MTPLVHRNLVLCYNTYQGSICLRQQEKSCPQTPGWHLRAFCQHHRSGVRQYPSPITKESCGARPWKPGLVKGHIKTSEISWNHLWLDIRSAVCTCGSFLGLKASSVSDPNKLIVLTQVVCSHMVRDMTEKVDPTVQSNGFHSAYFLVHKKKGGFFVQFSVLENLLERVGPITKDTVFF